MRYFVGIYEKENIHPDYAGKCLNIDPNSGGYPYAVDNISRAYIWNDLEEALNYRSKFENSKSDYGRFNIHEIYITVGAMISSYLYASDQSKDPCHAS